MGHGLVLNVKGWSYRVHSTFLIHLDSTSFHAIRNKSFTISFFSSLVYETADLRTFRLHQTYYKSDFSLEMHFKRLCPRKLEKDQFIRSQSEMSFWCDKNTNKGNNKMCFRHFLCFVSTELQYMFYKTSLNLPKTA